jgi:hypothetical protein
VTGIIVSYGVKPVALEKRAVNVRKNGVRRNEPPTYDETYTYLMSDRVR